MMKFSVTYTWLAVATTVMLSSCGGPDSGLGFGANGDGGLSGANGALGQALAPYIVLNLSDGSTTLEQSIPDLLTNPNYRTTSMVFKRLTGLSGTDYYLAVFECTQGQWKTLTLGAKPWNNIDASLLNPATFDADDRPAYNLSHNLILSVLNGFNLTASAHLNLPTLTQWRYACAAGTSSTWSWGNVADLATVSTYAAVYESQSAAARGPEVVASHDPNAFGIYDMHGNVWEWSGAGSHVMGGSWHDTIHQARTLNIAGIDNPELDASTSHALIGCRMVLVP